MSAELRVSSIFGEDALIINGFKIEFLILQDEIIYQVHRKGVVVSKFATLQGAVEWCKD